MADFNGKNHGVLVCGWDAIGQGWALECICGWDSTTNLLMEDVGGEFDNHLREVGMLVNEK